MTELWIARRERTAGGGGGQHAAGLTSGTRGQLHVWYARPPSLLPGTQPGGDPGIGRRTADHREHGRDLAPMMGGVVRDVVEQRPERKAEALALGAPVLDDSGQVALAQPLHEVCLLPL